MTLKWGLFFVAILLLVMRLTIVFIVSRMMKPNPMSEKEKEDFDRAEDESLF